MAKYKVSVPSTMEMGAYTTIVSDSYTTPQKDALSDYNSAREHDGLKDLKRMPKGTKYTKIK